MRIVSIALRNVGGVVDCDLELPDGQLIAVAGANGTGKSKLLSCLLFPWTRQLPAATLQRSPTVLELQFDFSPEEIAVMTDWDQQAGLNQGSPPAQATLRVERNVLAGISVTAAPDFMTVRDFGVNHQILKQCRSLDLLYLPAERRLLPPSQPGFDMGQLSDDLALAQTAMARGSAYNYGRLDDQEFESYAKALCVAGFLPREGVRNELSGTSRWNQFKESVDRLLHPKTLKSLTMENPDTLRIGLPGGGEHLVQDLSSGERQALIIMSRVFRAGEGHSLLAIDEPDAYLHPSLSSRLLQSLYPGLGDTGRLLVATHSPYILDSIPSEAIIRLAHDEAPRIVESEVHRMALYREAGFRASALTQADILVVTEGDFDAQVLPRLLPELASASFRAAGGRVPVMRTVEALSAYDLPILGVVDGDVLADRPKDKILEQTHIWSASDIEAVLLSSDEFLQCALDGQFVATEYRSLEKLRDLARVLLNSLKEEAVAEYAQRLLRKQLEVQWPSARGAGGIARLKAMEQKQVTISEDLLNAAIEEAEMAWNDALPDPWGMVRGKRIIGDFVNKATEFKTSDAFVLAVLARSPRIPDVLGLGEVIRVAKHRARNIYPANS